MTRLVAATAVALALGLVWFLVEPLVAPGTRWAVLAALVAVSALVALIQTARRAPTRLDAALEVDARFALRERLTSALSLPAAVRESPAGRALLADAETHAAPLRVRDKFALVVPRSTLRLPLLAALLAVVAFAYHPVTDSPAWVESRRKEAEAATTETRPAAKPVGRPKADERPGQSPQVKKLRAELDRIARDANPTPEQAREKLTELTSAEDKARAAEREAFDKLARVENKLRHLEALGGKDKFKDGPANDLNDALATGDLAKAEEAVEELRKKLKNKSLDAKDAAKLESQFDQMRGELQRLARNTDEQKKLQDLVDQAKREGRDTESLDRELERVKLDAEQMKALEELAKHLDAAKGEVRGDPAQAAKELERLAEQLRNLQGQVGDLQELREQLRRAEELKAEAGQASGEKGDGQKGAAGENGSGEKGAVGKAGGEGEGKGAGVVPLPGIGRGGGPGAGVRPENANAVTSRGADERQRTPFDPKGRKSYGGAVPGPAFTKRSPAEMGGTIAVAAQEAADAVANQPLSRDDKEAVREFIQGLGNQKKP